MRKAIIILFLLVGIAESAPPSRQAVYESGSIILSTENTANEDSIFNYLQAGVDSYADATIVNADIHSAANIQSDKLNLTAIAQAVGITSAGSFDNNGATTLDGTVGISGALTVTGSSTFSGTTIANLGTVTTAAFTAITNLGTVTTADINDGTMDNVQVGGTTATGELLVNDSADAADGLGSQGTTGQFLQSAGAGANPTWASSLVTETPVTFTTVGTTDDISVTGSERYIIFINITAVSTDLTLYLRFNSDSTGDDYGWNIQETAFSTTPSEALTGDDADTEIELGGLDTTNARYWFTLLFDNTRTNGVVFISGDSGGTDDTQGFIGREHHAIYSGGAPTSFELVTSTGTVSGTVTYYRFD